MAQILNSLERTRTKASATITRNIDWTTATVVRRPTLSASSAAWNPC
jgi:hypothetical protein